jgi:hypothetical protein
LNVRQEQPKLTFMCPTVRRIITAPDTSSGPSRFDQLDIVIVSANHITTLAPESVEEGLPHTDAACRIPSSTASPTRIVLSTRIITI